MGYAETAHRGRPIAPSDAVPFPAARLLNRHLSRRVRAGSVEEKCKVKRYAFKETEALLKFIQPKRGLEVCKSRKAIFPIRLPTPGDTVAQPVIDFYSPNIGIECSRARARMA